MPQKVSHTVTAQQVKKDDFIAGYGLVTSRDSKVKWTTITFSPRVTTPELEETLRVLNDAEITVIREEPTEEETQAKLVQRMVQGLDWKEKGARQALEDAREKMIKKLQAGDRASSWDWMDVPLYEARVELWDAVTHVHLYRATADDKEALTRREAVQLVVNSRKEQALAYYSATSRSSGVISNLFDDLKLQALSEWIRELEWIIA